MGVRLLLSSFPLSEPAFVCHFELHFNIKCVTNTHAANSDGCSSRCILANVHTFHTCNTAVLTVENVLTALEEVYKDWRRFGRELNVPASQIRTIDRSGKYHTPKDKTRAVLQYWWDVDPSRSWRRILWALDWGLHAADKVKPNVELVTGAHNNV